MLKIIRSNQFKRDIKTVAKRGKDLEKIKKVMLLLQEGKSLPSRYKDHPLKGNWCNFRDVHIEPDWVLIYKINDNEIRFERTWNHSDLFR
ncbi:type II toxin-antitoxin system YafQ family toxin [Bartonella sp. B41]